MASEIFQYFQKYITTTYIYIAFICIKYSVHTVQLQFRCNKYIEAIICFS